MTDIARQMSTLRAGAQSYAANAPSGEWFSRSLRADLARAVPDVPGVDRARFASGHSARPAWREP